MPQHSRRPGQGPLGRTFNRILGVSDSATDTGDMAFDRAQLRAYIDQKLQLAEGEWFRWLKLNGAADALMERLDTVGDGTVTWNEFQAFRSEILGAMAPDLEEDASPEQLEDAAAVSFEGTDLDEDGEVTLDEAQSRALATLPPEAENRDMVAQLGARLVLDAVDTDQREMQVAERRLSRAEWVTAAQELKKPA